MVSLPWYVLVLITAVLVATINIIKKHILNHEHALEQMASEAPFRFLAILFLIPFIEIPTPTQFGVIAVVAGILFFGQLYRNKSYRHLPISTVAPLMNLSPIFLLIIGVGVLGERITAIQLLGIGLLMFGGYVIDLKGRDLLGPLKHATKSQYTATVVVALIMISILGSMDKYTVQTLGVPAFTYLFWVYIIYITLTLTVHISKYGTGQMKRDITKGGKWLALAGILSITELAILFHALAIPGVLITLVVPLRRTATLLETAVGGKLFGEKRLGQKIFASLIMIAGVILIV